MYFNSSPILQVNPYGTGRRRREEYKAEQQAGRPSGRGGVDDPDVVQGRPFYASGGGSREHVQAKTHPQILR